MNRRAVVTSTALVAVGVLTGCALFYRRGEKPASTVSATLGSAPLIRPHAPVLGPARAPVTIVEFFDPACEDSRALHPVVKEIMADFPEKVRLVLRYATFHPTSEEAVRILEAARLQGKFEPVLEKLLESQPRWAPHGGPADSAWTVLEGTGLDLEQGKQYAMMPNVLATLHQDAVDIGTLGVRQTPTFFVNGKPLLGFGGSQLYELVRMEVEAI